MTAVRARPRARSAFRPTTDFCQLTLPLALTLPLPLTLTLTLNPEP